MTATRLFAPLVAALLASAAFALSVELQLCSTDACPTGTFEASLDAFATAKTSLAADLALDGYFTADIKLVLRSIDSVMHFTANGKVCGGRNEVTRLTRYLEMLRPRNPESRRLAIRQDSSSQPCASFRIYQTNSDNSRSFCHRAARSCKNYLDTFGLPALRSAYNCYAEQGELDCLSRCYLNEIANQQYSTCSEVQANTFQAEYGCQGDCLGHCVYSDIVACSD